MFSMVQREMMPATSEEGCDFEKRKVLQLIMDTSQNRDYRTNSASICAVPAV